HADLDAIDAGDLRQLDLLDWIGPAEVEAWRQLAHKFAESKHDTELFGVDPHGEAEEADQDNRNDGGQRTEGPGHATAWHGLAENLFKTRLAAAGSRGARAPGATAAALPTAAPALIAPRHDETSSRYVVKGGAKDRPCGAIS